MTVYRHSIEQNISAKDTVYWVSQQIEICLKICVAYIIILNASRTKKVNEI